MSRKKLTDFTIRLRRKDGQPSNEKDAKAAVWAAHKIAQKGGSAVEAMREWEIVAIDWRNVYASGREKTYTYKGHDVDEVFAALGGIFETLGLDKLRVGLVAQ